MEKLRIAIIGQGRSGRDIHGAYLQTPQAKEKFEVVAIVEQQEDRRKRAAEEFGCLVLEKYEDLYYQSDNIDLVINSSYSFQHHDITVDLLNHGFNVWWLPRREWENFWEFFSSLGLHRTLLR